MKYCIAIVLVFVTMSVAQLPKFALQGKLKCNGQDITDISWPSSCVTDWDGDGLKDLLIGEFAPNAKVRFYKNTGTNKAPEFKSYAYIKANGEDIKLTSG